MRGMVGSICILCAGLLAWQCQHTVCQRRRDTLADLLAALERMSEEIRQARTPLPRLLEQMAGACRPDAAALFREAAKAARRGDSLESTWRRRAASLPLDPGDREALGELRLWGDEESVRKGIALVSHRLTRSLEELEARRPEEEKRSAALCFSAAALLVILLI